MMSRLLMDCRSDKEKKHPNETRPLPKPRAGASIFGILATRSLARSFVARFRQRRADRLFNPNVQPTYQLSPIASKKFNRTKVYEIVKSIVDSRMNTFRYNPEIAGVMMKILTSECKDAVKKLNFDRCKIVVHVTIGEIRGQSVQLVSRCAWDELNDDTVSYSMQNKTVFCNAMIFGVYCE